MEKSHRFWWNFNMLKPMMNAHVPHEWCLRVIQGYVGFFMEFVSSRVVDFFLISRREWLRGGTRYSQRGIDEDGNAANQVRGSVPIYWQQVGLKATSELTRSFQDSRVGFKKHIERLNSDYGSIFCVNLMSKEKANEAVITKNFERLPSVSAPRLPRS